MRADGDTIWIVCGRCVYCTTVCVSTVKGSFIRFVSMRDSRNIITTLQMLRASVEIHQIISDFSNDRRSSQQ